MHTSARCGLLALIVLASCTEDLPPLSDATSLSCPYPGNLPFRTPSHGFAHAENRLIAHESTRSKDEASDTIGNPNGPVASIYIAQGTAPTASPITYRGAKGRTVESGGYFSKPLQNEKVSLWTYEGGAWMSIGATATAEDGTYELPDTGYVAPNGQPIYSVLDADGSCAEHYDYLYPRGTKVVLTDIDGTLTLDDMQLLNQIPDGSYVPKMMGAGDKLVQAWAAKGYAVIYLTARPHVFRPETRTWLHDLGFTDGPLITAAEVGDAGVYKTEWVKRMAMTFGWTIVAAYGNADTDITAYENGGIPKNQTFIVGPLAGNRQTVAIPDQDFTAHIASFVAGQPDNH
ncbi:hypothetical protein BH11MYX3_BH11MYX3_17690 [soil metagenome]